MAALLSQKDIQRYSEVARVAATGLIRIGQLVIDIGQTVHQTANAVDKAAAPTVRWTNSEPMPTEADVEDEDDV